MKPFIVVAIAFLAFDPQGARTPPRDLRTEPIGTAVISGIVQTDDAASRPLRRATVRLSGDQLFTSRQVLTADDGRYEFAGLAAGQYTVNALKATYASAAYGARRPGGSGSTIALTEGQRLTNINVRLGRYASISGIIYDQNGEPVQGISVEALQYTMRTGTRSLSSVYGRPETTDDRGAFRIGGLSPGQYYVAAGPSPDRGPRDVQVLSTADIDRALQMVNSPSSTAAAAITFSRQHQGFAPVFFPDSTEFNRAQSIAVALGEDRTGVDIHLQLVPTARIDGVVTGPDGRPVPSTQVLATAVTEANSMDLFSPGSLGVVPVDGQGRFTYPAVPPGLYVITARTTATGFWATTDLSVSGVDQNVALTLQPGMSVSGRIVFAGTTVQPPATMAGVRVNMTSAQTGRPGVTIGVTPATTNGNGTFIITGAPPGNYKLAISSPPGTTGWSLRSAIVEGIDALDHPFTIRPGLNIDNVIATFTDRPTEVSGTLQAPTGTPTSDYFIIVFATDQTYWGASSRRTAMVRPSTNGRYTVRNLPPGEYFVAAVTDVEQGAWFDPAFLRALVQAATRIALTEGDRRTLDLKIGG
jgi:carboxypeptidase family protein